MCLKTPPPSLGVSSSKPIKHGSGLFVQHLEGKDQPVLHEFPARLDGQAFQRSAHFWGIEEE